MTPSVITCQPGPQENFLKSAADILLFGGAAGGGKSYALLLDPLYHYENSLFNGVIFRRNTTQVRNPGGLWDTSFELYTQIKGHPREAFLEWVFPSGMNLKFAHLENEKTIYDWQGSQLAWIGFDELTHFTEKQFWYLLSRNRSMSGVPGKIRATCNPDTDSWVRRFIDWWIDKDGFPIPERSGILRWFIRENDNIVWSDSSEELTAQCGNGSIPKSFTFIPSLLRDNKILMERDPSYLSNLMALSRVERMRLLDGNWNVRATAGMLFQRNWFPIIDSIPPGWIQLVRYWDKAATKPHPENPDPDWTRGAKLYKYPNGTYVLADMRGLRDRPAAVEDYVKHTASYDSIECPIGIEQEPGSSGVADADNYVRMLAGYNVRVRKPTQDKMTRALPVSAQCERSNVHVLRGPWNDAFFNEVENFPSPNGHDDQVDALSGAFNELSGGLSLADVL